MREWLRERMAIMDARIVQSISDKRQEYLKQLEALEVEAGTQVMDEARRTVQFLGKQFLLESDLDERDLTCSRKGTTNIMMAASMRVIFVGIQLTSGAPYSGCTLKNKI